MLFLAHQQGMKVGASAVITVAKAINRYIKKMRVNFRLIR